MYFVSEKKRDNSRLLPTTIILNRFCVAVQKSEDRRTELKLSVIKLKQWNMIKILLIVIFHPSTHPPHTQQVTRHTQASSKISRPLVTYITMPSPSPYLLNTKSTFHRRLSLIPTTSSCLDKSLSNLNLSTHLFSPLILCLPHSQ